MNEAKELFKSSTGAPWRFDHVWSKLKELDKFKPSSATLPSFVPCSGNYESSQSDYSPTQKSPMSNSPGLSGFSLNLDDDGPSSGGSQRPMGIKKAKRKLKGDENSKALSTMANCSERMMNMMENAEASQQELINIEKDRNSIAVRREENKILRMNPMS